MLVLYIHTSLVNVIFVFFFFNDTATTEIYTLSLHDALPIYSALVKMRPLRPMVLENFKDIPELGRFAIRDMGATVGVGRSEEHTSELQSLAYLVCRLLLEKKKIKNERSYRNRREQLKRVQGH